MGKNCWCGSGLPYEACHKAIEDKMRELRAEGYRLPNKRLIKNTAQIEGCREAGRINAMVLDKVAENIRVGMTTQDIDDIVYTYTKELG